MVKCSSLLLHPWIFAFPLGSRSFNMDYSLRLCEASAPPPVWGEVLLFTVQPPDPLPLPPERNKPWVYWTKPLAA